MVPDDARRAFEALGQEFLNMGNLSDGTTNADVARVLATALNHKYGAWFVERNGKIVQ